MALSRKQPRVLERHRGLRGDAFDQAALASGELAALTGIVRGEQTDKAVAEVEGHVERQV